MAKALTKEQRAQLLSLKQDELSVPVISRLFGKTAKKIDGKMVITDPPFDTKSKLHLNAGEYINKEAVDTTVGSFLFNKLMVEGMIDHIIPNGYFNEVVDKKGFKSIIDKISEALMMGKLDIEPNLIKWLKHYEFYGMKICTIFSPSYTKGLLQKNIKVQKEKQKLLKNIDTSDVKKMTEVEDKLVAASAEILKDDPGMTLFTSGARGSFDNDYKNMNLMLGPVAVPGKPGEFDMVTSNYIEGLQKEDLVAAGRSVINASYPKAVGTQKAGYQTKKFYAGYQSVQCDEDGTDCGTQKGINLVLTEDNVEKYYFQNIVTSKGYVVLTSDNKDKFLNKKVLIRSPMYCKGNKLCSVCSGRRFYIMGIRNSGLTAGRVTNTLLNASMKNFHNAKLKFDTVDINDLLK